MVVGFAGFMVLGQLSVRWRLHLWPKGRDSHGSS